MKTQHNDVVEEYLSEVDQRLAGLPVLQRRELLADLRAHIATERAERNLSSEGELIEVLERLGSPEVVAAAAHEEAGAQAKNAPAPRARRIWPWLTAAAGAVVVLILLFGAMTFARNDSGPQISEQVPAIPAEPFPTADRPDPAAS